MANILALPTILFVHLFTRASSHLLLDPQCSCKIPVVNPFEAKAIKALEEFTYRTCKEHPQLTRIQKDAFLNRFVIKIDDFLLRKHQVTNPTCCMRSVTRIGDDSHRRSSCINFSDFVIVPPDYEFILVKCEALSPESLKKAFGSVYFVVQEKPEVKNRFKEADQSFPPTSTVVAPSVLVIGLDSVSSINFQRTAGNVHEFLKDNGYFHMKGYNKVGDNTFPNLMAALGGYNIGKMPKNCSAYRVGGLDRCPLVWADYKKNGYATAYMEDVNYFSTFNYHKKGFKEQPVDHYGRSAMDLVGNGLCSRGRFTAEYVYSYGLDFAKFYKGRPSFGFFWTNSMTHDDITGGAQIAPLLLKTLREIRASGVQEESFVLVLSDHGMRFGRGKQFDSSFYDLRMPLFYISMPRWFQEAHPEAANALLLNQHRLTSPYDLFLTLKDILRHSGRLPPGEDRAPGCPTCQSLFRPVPYRRECADAGIPEEWCACKKYTQVNTSTRAIVESANAFVIHLNSYIGQLLRDSDQNPDDCVQYQLNRIVSGAVNEDNHNTQVVISVRPGNATFEAFLKYDKNSYQLAGSIARTSKYAHSNTKCATTDRLKAFCECKRR